MYPYWQIVIYQEDICNYLCNICESVYVTTLYIYIYSKGKQEKFYCEKTQPANKYSQYDIGTQNKTHPAQSFYAFSITLIISVMFSSIIENVSESSLMTTTFLKQRTQQKV